MIAIMVMMMRMRILLDICHNNGVIRLKVILRFCSFLSLLDALFQDCYKLFYRYIYWDIIRVILIVIPMSIIYFLFSFCLCHA